MGTVQQDGHEGACAFRFLLHLSSPTSGAMQTDTTGEIESERC